MKPPDLSRLHTLRMENTASGYRLDELRPRFAALASRHEDGTAPRAVTAYNLFQTPEPLAARMAALAGILPAHRVLEPSAGLGRLLRAILPHRPATLTACESSPDCARELFHAFPHLTLHQGDFLTRTLGLFDRILMNPPFHMRDDIRHTLHALSHLAPGGRLVGLAMHTPHREKALRPLSSYWEILPAATFRAEGTTVETVLFCIDQK